MILAFVFATFLVGALADKGCPEGFIRWGKGKTCYHISDIKATRQEAQMYCEVFDANLVSVETEMENYFLKFAIKNKLVNAPGDYHMKKLKFMKGRNSYWTAGIHKEGTSGCAWQADERDDAEPMDYTYYGVGQPNATTTYIYEQWGKMKMHQWKMMMHGGMSMKQGHGGMGSKWGHKKYQKKHGDDSSNDSEEKKGHYGKRYQHHSNSGMASGYQSKYQTRPQYATSNRRQKRASPYPENWQDDATNYNEENDEDDEDSSSDEDEQRHAMKWHVKIPDLRGNNCTIIRKCMMNHNISWYSVPCVETGVHRFFICEKPCSMAAQADIDDDDTPYPEVETEPEGEPETYSEPYQSPYQG